MRRLFAADYGVAEYRAHIGRLLGLYEPLERAFAGAGGRADAFDIHARTQALRADLRAMGATAKQAGQLERHRPFTALTTLESLGYAYVLFGSMLGAKLITARLRRVLGDAASYHFYAADQPEADRMWQSYCDRLQRDGGANVALVCAAAMEMFDVYAAWLSPASEIGVAS